MLIDLFRTTKPKKGDKWKITRAKGLWLYKEPTKSCAHLLRLKSGTVFTVHDVKFKYLSCFAKVKKQDRWGWVLIYDRNGTYCRLRQEGASELVEVARSLAWAKGTPPRKYAWVGGTATNAFKTALNDVYPDRGSWGNAPRVGCSCDVFVGTCIRSAGIDPKYPRGLEQQFKYNSDAFERHVYKNAKPIEKAKYGDVILFDYAGNGAHTVIMGNGVYYEAGYQTTYGHVNTSLERLKKTFPTVIILRPNRG